jgi:hypothetical protein
MWFKQFFQALASKEMVSKLSQTPMMKFLAEGIHDLILARSGKRKRFYI